MSNNDQKDNSIIQTLGLQLDHFFKMHKDSPPDSGLYEKIIKEVERILIQKTMNYTDSVHVKAAKILGINRNTLRKKIKELKIK